MRKSIIICMVILFFTFGLDYADTKKSTRQEHRKKSSPVVLTKTYILKHVTPNEVRNALRVYFYESSYDRNKKFLTIQIPESNVAKFEELLKKMDIPKRTITFRIFTVTASKQGKMSPIGNRDLKEVLAELQKLLDFKYFKLDGASLLTVKEGTNHSEIRLSSSLESLYLELRNIIIGSNHSGFLTVNIGRLLLYQPVGNKSRIFNHTSYFILEL